MGVHFSTTFHEREIIHQKWNDQWHNLCTVSFSKWKIVCHHVFSEHKSQWGSKQLVFKNDECHAPQPFSVEHFAISSIAVLGRLCVMPLTCSFQHIWKRFILKSSMCAQSEVTRKNTLQLSKKQKNQAFSFTTDPNTIHTLLCMTHLNDMRKSPQFAMWDAKFVPFQCTHFPISLCIALRRHTVFGFFFWVVRKMRCKNQLSLWLDCDWARMVEVFVWQSPSQCVHKIWGDGSVSVVCNKVLCWSLGLFCLANVWFEMQNEE